MLSCLSQQETGTTGNNVVLGEGAAWVEQAGHKTPPH